MQSAQVVTLKSGQANASLVDSKSPMHSFELRTSSTPPRCSRVTSNPDDLFFDELMILINKGLGGKSRYVPILAELAQELRTHLGDWQTDYLFETNRHLASSLRGIQQIVKATAEKANRALPLRMLNHRLADAILLLSF